MPGSIGLPISLPPKSPELAEFIGIMLGDGGMSRYQATVTLHHVDDRAYSRFVSSIVRQLFAYTPGVDIRKARSVITIVMSRVELVRLLQSLGLPIGDKIRHGITIPPWIRNEETLFVSCIRGLIETDGSVFTHRYVSKGKRYAYKKLSFTSASPSLLRSVAHALTDLGMRPRIGSNRDVRLDSVGDMEWYFSIIGTHNPKHLRRYRL